MTRAWLIVAAGLAGCGAPNPPEQPPPDLETAAIARGVVRDMERFDPVGLYAHDTDRLCIVASGAAYRIGASVDYGEGIACNAIGTARRSGTALRIDFGNDCRFDAQYDGDRIGFPAELPGACRASCKARASLASVRAARVSASASEAAAMRNSDGRTPCSTS